MGTLASISLDSLAGQCGIFVLCAIAIAYLGVRLTAAADQLADRTGIGEALMGGIFLGAVTSISGSIFSVTAAFRGEPELALSNCLGGMGAQMAFLAVSDLFHRKANLEHAAASNENIMQGAILICSLSILLMAMFSPAWSVWGVHPATPLMLGAYAWGMSMVNKARRRPMWTPRLTDETRTDQPQAPQWAISLPALWIRFSAFALSMGAIGWYLEGVAGNIIEKSGISAVVMGMLFTSVATSLPELVTSIAAVRRGALTLAVSGIIGGNAYDTLFAAFSDIAYRDGSIYHKMTPTLGFWTAVNLLMTGLLLMGLLYREKRGFANIGFESALTLALYGLAVGVVVATG